MYDATARWIWPPRGLEMTVFAFTEDHRRAIARTIAYWETAEVGAPCLADDAGELLSDAAPSEWTQALDLFMSCAVLPRGVFRVRNPYRDMRAGASWLLGENDHASDSAVLDPVRALRDFDFEAQRTDVAAWNAADRRFYGINPKRPFGTSQVCRDLRSVIDPEKSLSTAAWSKQCKQLRSRMLLMLQAFVQHAELAPGVYEKNEHGLWQLQVQRVTAGWEEHLTEGEWQQRLERDAFYRHLDYFATISALQHLVWEARVPGQDYAQWCQQHRLHDLYGPFEDGPGPTHDGLLVEKLSTALEHFPEDSGEADGSLFTMLKVRASNATAAFAQARDAMIEARLASSQQAAADFSVVSWTNVLHVEQCILERGLGTMSADAWGLAVSAPGSGPWGDHACTSINDWIRKLIDACDEFGDVDSVLLAHARAMAAQVKLMLGANPDTLRLMNVPQV
jgi:hypothetical protein